MNFFPCNTAFLWNSCPSAAQRLTIGTASQGFDGQRIVRQRVRYAHNGRTGYEGCFAVSVKLHKQLKKKAKHYFMSCSIACCMNIYHSVRASLRKDCR